MGLTISHDDGVATVRMTDAATANALTHDIVEAITATFTELGRDRRVHAIVFAGLPDVFSSGASRSVIEDLASARRDSGELVLPRAMLDCPVPCISAMAGYAIGGGFALGVAADIIVLGAESRYSINFLDLGFTPGMGTTALFEHVLSPAVAHELMFTCEARRGRDLARTGFNHVLPRDEVDARAHDLAARIADKPREAVIALKRTLSIPRRQAFEAARTQEALMHAAAFAHLANQTRKQES